MGVVAAACAACAEAEDPASHWSTEELRVIATLSPIPPPPSSPSNRWADDAGAAAIGEALFFDARLSGDGSLSCATCHDPQTYFTDGRRTSFGRAEGARNTPTVLGAAHFAFLMWDGRKDSLWSQALGPIETAEEMGSHRLSVARLVRSAYRTELEAVFGPLPAAVLALGARADVQVEEEWARLSDADRDAVDRVFTLVGKSIEAYERGLDPEPAPFDEYVAALLRGEPDGGGVLSPAATRGLRAFLGPAGCVHCHNGPLFTDQAFHRMGLPDGGTARDPGRRAGLEELLADPFRSDGPMSDGVTPDLVYIDRNADGTEGAFKTPTLRNVTETAPYGHAGQFASLAECLESYRSLPRRAADLGLDPVLQTIDPRFDIGDMIAFLETLTGPMP